MPIKSVNKHAKEKNNDSKDLNYAIIYTSDTVPEPLKHERQLLTPIRMVPTNPRHLLKPEHRIYYSKVYTIEYNVKVWFIGSIHRHSKKKLVEDYNRVHPPLAISGVPTGPVTEDSVPYTGGYQASRSEYQSMGAGMTHSYQNTSSGTQYRSTEYGATPLSQYTSSTSAGPQYLSNEYGATPLPQYTSSATTHYYHKAEDSESE